MLAQTIGEYGGLASLIAKIERAVYSVNRWVRTAGPEVWLGVAAAVLLLLWLWRRR